MKLRASGAKAGIASSACALDARRSAGRMQAAGPVHGDRPAQCGRATDLTARGIINRLAEGAS